MKKCLLEVLTVVSFALFSIFYIMPASANCSKDVNSVKTGAACSISELNNLDENKSVYGMFNTDVTSCGFHKRNLRPVNPNLQARTQQPLNKGCPFGVCLVKKIFGD